MQSNSSLNRTLGGAVAIIGGVALLTGLSLAFVLSSLREAAEARGHSYQIVIQLNTLRAAMLNQETGIRGFLLTRRQDSLDPYHLGVTQRENATNALRELLRNEPSQMARLGEAERAATEWQTEFGASALSDTSEPAAYDAALRTEKSGEGKKRFDVFRAALSAIERDEKQFLAAHQENLRDAESTARLTMIVGVCTTLIVCLLMASAINRRIARPLTKLAETMRQLVNRDLSVEVPAVQQQDEVGEMARAVAFFKDSLAELDRTSLLRATTDTLPAMIGYVDKNRRIGFINSEFARWFDLPSEDIAHFAGQPMTNVFAHGRFPGALRELDAALAGEDVRSEHRLLRRGAAMRDVEAVYRPHKRPDGSVLGVVALLTDITDRKRMDRRLAQHAKDLERSNEELEQFAYVASHDLKAPLRGIDNLVTWIEEDLDETLAGETRGNMELLKSRVRRLESLLDDLLAYSRAGRGGGKPESVDTRKLVEELSALVSPPEGFKITASETLPTLETLRAPLTQIFQNLFANAIKHHPNPSTGTFAVGASQDGDFTRFVATDNGPGIPEQFRERVFGMFQTLRPRDEVEGSGMGLAIVKKLVANNGGRVWLETAEGGQGLAVHFTWSDKPQRSSDGTDG